MILEPVHVSWLFPGNHTEIQQRVFCRHEVMLASYKLKTHCSCCLRKGLQVARSTQGQSISIQPALLSHSSAVFTWAWLSKRGRCNSVAGGQGSLHKRLSVESEPWAGQTGLTEPSPYALFESVCNKYGYKLITEGSLDYKTHWQSP